MMLVVLLLLTLLQCNFSIGTKVRITNKPHSGTIILPRRASLALSCNADVQTPLPLDWYIPVRPNQEERNTDMSRKIYIQRDADGRKMWLYVKDLTDTDQGKYRCAYWNKFVNPRQLVSNDTVYVKLKEEIILEQGDLEQWIKLGGRGWIYCRFRGDNLVVSWWLGNREVRTGGRYTIDPKIGLSIDNVVIGDVGTYTCKATMIGKTLFRDVSIKVKVYTRPRITFGPEVIYPEGLVATEGWDAYLQCKAEGMPEPTIHWYRKSRPNQELQNLNPQKYFVNSRYNIGKLRIADVNYNEDQDTYICRAALTSKAIKDNKDDMYVDKEIRVDVAVIPRFEQLDQLHRHVDLGGTVTINCRVFATDTPSAPLTIVFQKWNASWGDPQSVPYKTCAKDVICRQDDPRVTTKRTLSPYDSRVHNLFLTVEKTVTTDSDNYTCMAWNAGGNRTRNGTISVWHVPDLSTNKLTETYGWLRNATNLTCTSYGLPHPLWRWYRREAEIVNTVNGTYKLFSYDYGRFSRTWLQIVPNYGTERWIFTTYRCNATNIKGTSAHNIEFRRAHVPGIPKVAVNSTSSSTVIFNVEPPDSNGGMGLIQYEMQYRAATGSIDWYGPVFLPLDHNMVVHGLMPETEYTFQLSARNIVGRGQWGLTLIRTGDRQVPSKVKVMPGHRAVYPYSHIVRWSVPSNGGSPLTGYRIKVRAVELSEVTWEVSGVRGRWRTYMPQFYNPYLKEFRLTELNADTGYEGTISAINRVGESEETKFTFKTPSADKLGRPDRVVSDSCVFLSNNIIILLAFFMAYIL